MWFLCMYRHASDMCMFAYYSNTASTNTVLDTPSGATPTMQDVTASPTEHSKLGISAYQINGIPKNNKQ